MLVNERGYGVTIDFCSKELSAKERVALKNITDAVRLDEVTQIEPQDIKPSYWAKLNIHNEHSENKDYSIYIVVDENGTKYVTSSESFWTSFNDIVDEMKEEKDTDWGIHVFRKESKNYKGKEFITCSII